MFKTSVAALTSSATFTTKRAFDITASLTTPDVVLGHNFFFSLKASWFFNLRSPLYSLPSIETQLGKQQLLSPYFCALLLGTILSSRLERALSVQSSMSTSTFSMT